MSGNAQAPRQGTQTDISNPSSMSPGVGFEAVWRELRPRTIALLVRRGAPQDVADDVAQETAIRLLKNWHLLDESRPTWPFVRRVALNCLIDRHRRERFDTLESVPDRVGPFDVEEQSLARFRLTEVWRAMAGLTPKERAILLAEVGVPGHYANNSATKMARHRARQKLTAAVGRSGAFSGLPLTWRRFTGWLQLHGPTAYVDVGTAAGLAVIVSAAALSWGQVGHAAVGPKAHPLRSTPVAEVRSESGHGASDIVEPRPAPAKRQASSEGSTRPASVPTPTPSPSSTGATAGPARAEAGSYGDSTYIKVCTGEETPATYDDAEIVVVVDGGDEDPKGEGPECNHGDEEEEKP